MAKAAEASKAGRFKSGRPAFDGLALALQRRRQLKCSCGDIVAPFDTVVGAPVQGDEEAGS
jgi:hypothetical protein